MNRSILETGKTGLGRLKYLTRTRKDSIQHVIMCTPPTMAFSGTVNYLGNHPKMEEYQTRIRKKKNATISGSYTDSKDICSWRSLHSSA